MLPNFTTQGDAERDEPISPLGKVELDLEGAPFLEPDPADAPPEDTGPKSAVAAQTLESEAPKKNRKKLFILLGGVVLGILLLVGAALYMIVFRSTEPKPSDSEFEIVVVPSTPPEMPEASVNKFNISWQPFWVEVADPEGEIRFVYCKIMLVTDNQRVALQIANKGQAMRDAVYYYLRHKPYSFLADLRQLDVLKSEILNIINYYIIPETVIPPGLQPGQAPPPDSPKERLNEILIEEYLIK